MKTKLIIVFIISLLTGGLDYSFCQVHRGLFTESLTKTKGGAADIVLKAGYFIPNVVRYDYTGNLVFKAVLSGAEPTEIFLSVDNEKYYLNRKGNNTGFGPEGVEYTVTLDAQNIIKKMQPDDVFRVFVGFLDIFQGTQRILRANEFVQIWNNMIPMVKVNETPGGLYYSENVINVVKDLNYDNASYEIQNITKIVYREFEDTYDFISMVLVPGYNANRYHINIKNETKGIGLNIYNSSYSFGSNGKLIGMEFFPLPGFYDGASHTFSHEIGHQWINFLFGTPFEIGIPHWPYCNHSLGIMGISIGGQSGQGGSFQYSLSITNGEFKFIPYKPSDPGSFFQDLDLYLMGLIPPGLVGNKYIFKYPNSVPVINQVYNASDFIFYTVNELITAVGERIPNSLNSQKKFKILSIVVSPEKLTDVEHSFYDYFTKRATGKEAVTVHEGLLKEVANPFYKATKGLGSLETNIELLYTSANSGSFYDYSSSVVPNPSNGRFKLEMKKCKLKNCLVQVFNESGQLLISRFVLPSSDYHIEEFNLTDEPKGVYIVKIINGGMESSKKVIFQ
jgi:hypothetical protein